MRTMSNFRCKGWCKRFPNAEHSSYHWKSEGKRFCTECNYKMTTEQLICDCCGAFMKRGKNKPTNHKFIRELTV